MGAMQGVTQVLAPTWSNIGGQEMIGNFIPTPRHSCCPVHAVSGISSRVVDLSLQTTESHLTQTEVSKINGCFYHRWSHLSFGIFLTLLVKRCPGVPEAPSVFPWKLRKFFIKII